MKTIKIRFVGYYRDLNTRERAEKTWIYQILCKKYNVVISDDPDYIICYCFDLSFPYCNYNGIRIFISDENVTPDFNLVDYAISSYPITYLDRHFRKPVFVPFSDDSIRLRESVYDMNFLQEKSRFANFITSHESEGNVRGDFFRELQKYKRVDSPGTYLNNMPDGQIVHFGLGGGKRDFQKTCKFTLCFESTSHNGFITEKLLDAFAADTIPIYYGSQDVSEIFNPESFLNLMDYTDMYGLIERIIELDQNDEEYLKMMNQPVFNDPMYLRNLQNELIGFVYHIFDQPLDQAYRRSRIYLPKQLNDFHKKYGSRYARSQHFLKPIKRIRSIIANIVKRNQFLRDVLTRKKYDTQ